MTNSIKNWLAIVFAVCGRLSLSVVAEDLEHTVQATVQALRELLQ